MEDLITAIYIVDKPTTKHIVDTILFSNTMEEIQSYNDGAGMLTADVKEFV